MKLIEIRESGMTELEIEELTREENNHPTFMGAPYWTAEIYSFGKYIRKYGFYPSFLPLAIYTDHGPGQIANKPFCHELEMDAPVMFYHSPESVAIWKNFSNKPCKVLFSPFIFCRRINKIEKLKNAKGTIAFPTHSTPQIDNLSSIEKYIADLKALPEKFQPISVCLHISDIRKGDHRMYMNQGIPVFTSGGNNGEFAERFYQILRNFSYATSNMVGSSLYYAVEMGVPFFIYGDKPVLLNKGDANVVAGGYDFYAGHEYYQNLHDIFSTLECEITPEKRMIVERDTGVISGLSRFSMSLLLYMAFAKWVVSGLAWRWFKKNFSNLIKRYGKTS